MAERASERPNREREKENNPAISESRTKGTVEIAQLPESQEADIKIEGAWFQLITPAILHADFINDISDDVVNESHCIKSICPTASLTSLRPTSHTTARLFAISGE